MDRFIFPLEAGRVGQSVGIRLCLVGHYSLSKYLDPLLTRNTIWALLLRFLLLGAHHYAPVTGILVIVYGSGWDARGHAVVAHPRTLSRRQIPLSWHCCSSNPWDSTSALRTSLAYPARRLRTSRQ